MLDTLLTREWGLRYPLIGAPMAGVGFGRLARAVSEAGALGMIGIGAREPVERVATESALASDGTWMVVEPSAGDTLEENLNPIGRIYYAASTMLCTPASLSQEVGLALGAQAGEAKLRAVMEEAGFKRFRRATQTPFNIVYEVKH